MHTTLDRPAPITIEEFRTMVKAKHETSTNVKVPHNLLQLMASILPLSESKDFKIAKSEWVLDFVEVHDKWDQCPCGQAIKELCHIRNTINGNRIYVGNTCVDQFLGIKTGNLFEGLKRIKDDPTGNPNKAVIEYARNQGFLYGNELDFLTRTARKHSLSEAQLSWKKKINYRILNKTVVQT